MAKEVGRRGGDYSMASNVFTSLMVLAVGQIMLSFLSISSDSADLIIEGLLLA